MYLYPAIDVRDRGLARAPQELDPVAAARAIMAAGAGRAHVVDLDRVFGTGQNDAVIRDVLGALHAARVQVGGGLRSVADVADVLGWGAARVVVGAEVAADLPVLAAAVGPDRLALAIDVRDGLTTSPSGVPVRVSPDALLAASLGAGVVTIVYRDRGRDGTLRGADFGAAARLLTSGGEIVFAGGVATLDDLRRARDHGFAGVIVGRALLNGRFTLAEALACCG